jgi:aspartate/glutamate racemase
MTELLKQAIAKVQNLPENEQDNIAAIILEELEDEAKWEESFTASQDLLASLASEAMQEYEAGETQELDPETM